ncbi:hypothetical protein AciM339_1054 [Aciduliprofundum sp. MAR08-339]|uniref:PIN domain-containing protein n=1 Tax=Aciduliprofundum sp. (strain MAR08-339) TaxID=673860 RepID=UPI0002A4C04D|nr:hypothetical protein AciM339_1054 [Aciduliprofundum sp. MAR08-339]
MIISKEEIHVLLNEFVVRGIREARIEYPPFQIPLFTLNLENFKVENLLTQGDMDNARKKYAKGEFLRRDLPDYYDLLDSFLSSAIVDFENEDEIREEFKILRESMKNKKVYIRPVFIGIDTNIAYYRVVSRRLGKEFEYVISQIVVDEVDARIHTKYTGKMLYHFESLPYHSILHEFANGSVKESRKAKNAMNEIYYLFDVLDALRTGESTDTRDKEIRDREIAKQYGEFAENFHGEVVLITADKDMVFHAQAQGLSSIYYKLPHRLDVDTVDPLKISNLFYDMITNFGILKINDTVILAEWRGKEVDDYMNERMKIYNVDEYLTREIRVCRGVIDEL